MAGFSGNTDNEPTSGLGGEQRGPDFTYDRDSVGDAERNAAGAGGAAEEDEANQLDGQNNDLNYSPGDDSGKKDRKRGGIFARRGGIIGIALTGVGLISTIFLGSSALPFSILGNMNAKSVLNGLQQYADDYYGFVIFGKTNSSRVKVSATGDKLKGLRDTEVTQLKAKGVTFEPAEGTKTKTGKYVFEKVKVKGGNWVDASNFSEAMKDSSFRTAMRFEKGSLYKSAKSQAFAIVKNMFKLNSNPDLKGDTPEDSGNKLVAEATDDVASSVDTPTVDGKDDPQASQKQQGLAVAGELGSEINAEKAAITAGTANLTTLAADGDMSNVGYLMSKLGIDINTATKNIGQQIWGFVNVLDPLDMVCTVYQTAYTANMISRTIILYNVVKFGMTMITAIERAQAGEDTDNSMSNLMSLLTQTDPNTGRSFTASSYASFLFSGQLSSEPSSVSTFGGSAMLMLYTAMHALHSGVGTFVSAGTAGDINSARFGRAFLKNTCGVATNLGVQLGATAASIVVGIFTGGTATAAALTAKTTALIALKDVIKKLGEKFGKEAIEKALKKKWEEVVAEGLVKTMAKDSWQLAKTTFKSMDTWGKLGFLMAGVSTFGMSYIIHALSGGTIAGYTKNPVSMMDSLGTARQQTDFLTGLGAGGSVATYAQTTAYESTRQQYETAYVEDMQYAAKSTPFDMKNPYSAAGRVAYSIQKTIGVPTTTDPLSTLTAIATLPFRLTNATTATAASESMTPEAVGAYIGNEFYTRNQIAQNITGSPQLIFQKNYTFSDVIAKLVDSDNPQMSFDGFDSTTNEPKLSVIPGSDMAAYVDACKNPAKTELDPEFEDEDTHNLYDIDTCIKGGSKYKNDVYPLYDDGLRFANQVNPEATAAPSGTATTGCPSISGIEPISGITKGWEKSTGKERAISLCAIAGTEMSVVPLWQDTRYEGTSAAGISTIAVNSKGAEALLAAVKAAKSEGVTLKASVGYRSLYEQCSILAKPGNLGSKLPSECPSWVTAIPGDWSSTTLYSNHLMGNSIDFVDAASKNWMIKCMNEGLGGRANRCYGFWNDVWQTENWDEGHFTYDP